MEYYLGSEHLSRGKFSDAHCPCTIETMPIELPRCTPGKFGRQERQRLHELDKRGHMAPQLNRERGAAYKSSQSYESFWFQEIYRVRESLPPLTPLENRTCEGIELRKMRRKMQLGHLIII